MSTCPHAVDRGASVRSDHLGNGIIIIRDFSLVTNVGIMIDSSKVKPIIVLRAAVFNNTRQ